MIAEIKALDTLFFRDGKPFARGEETWANGIFPPYPSVIFGALRTWYLSEHPKKLSNDSIEEIANIRLKQIKYRVAKNIYVPMPLDLAKPKREEDSLERLQREYGVIRLEPSSLATGISNYPCKLILGPPSEEKLVESVEGGLMQQSDFISYLNASLQHYKIKILSDYVKQEPKTGIGRNDNTNTAADSLLYRVGMSRAPEFEILIDYEWPAQNHLSLQQPYFVKIGAENKIAEIRKSRLRIEINPNEVHLKPGKFKLYLSTPAIFENGWKPDLSKYNIQASLVAAVVGKPLHIGGFDMMKGMPKTMYKAVPAGSVYLFETTESVESLKEKLFEKAISDQWAEQGFGITYIGNW